MKTDDMPDGARFVADARAAVRSLEKLLARGAERSPLSGAELEILERAHAMLRVRAHEAARLAQGTEAFTSPEVEEAVGVRHEDLAALFALDGIRGLGPQKFRDFWVQGLSPGEVLAHPDRLSVRGKSQGQLRDQIARLDEIELDVARERAADQLARAQSLGARILTYSSPEYPPNVFASNNAVPVLWALGATEILKERRVVACVGSRDIRPPYSERQRGFAAHAAHDGWIVASGFAVGADTVAHEGAVEAGGRTVLVMPSGLDRPFPPENRDFWKRLTTSQQACAVSEFPLGTTASSLTLRKRNKLIVAVALGVLIGQSSAKGGAMNAFRFAQEQRKPVTTFEPDGSPDTTGNLELLASRDLTLAPSEPEEGLDVTSAAFPASRDHLGAYDQWLQELSSSI